MGFDEAKIILDSPNGAYYPGQTVRGQLEFDFDKVEIFRGIYVEINGLCKVHWITIHEVETFGRKETRTKYHDAYEEYLNRTMYLIGGNTGEVHLQPGHYSYPFDCKLPANCPSSFEGASGHIRYQVKAVIDRAFQLLQRALVFRVIVPVDLNYNPLSLKPIDMEITNTYCCLCISTGATETLVKLPVSGFCPGQIIATEVSCNNTSNVDIECIRLTMKRAITFHAEQTPNITVVKDQMAEIKTGPIPGNNNRKWTIEMKVPAMDVYNFDNCRFIDIYNYFKVTVETGSWHENGRDSRQIIIGSIPLRGFQDDIKNPLKDQMPSQPYIAPNVQVVNAEYPIVNQPLPTNTPYPVPNNPNDSFYHNTYSQPNTAPYPTENIGPIGFNPNGGSATIIPQIPPNPGSSSNIGTHPHPSSALNIDSNPSGASPNSLSNVGPNPPYPMESSNIVANLHSAKVQANPPYPVEAPNIGANLHPTKLHPKPPYPVESPNIDTNPHPDKLRANPPYPVEAPNIGANLHSAKLHLNTPYSVESPNIGANPHPDKLHSNPPYPVEYPNIGANPHPVKLHLNPPYPVEPRNIGANPAPTKLCPYPVQSLNIGGSPHTSKLHANPPYPGESPNIGANPPPAKLHPNPPYPVESPNIDGSPHPDKLHTNPPYPVESPNIGTNPHAVKLHPNPPYPVESSNIGATATPTKLCPYPVESPNIGGSAQPATLFPTPKSSSPYNSRGSSSLGYSSPSPNIPRSFLKTGIVGFIIQSNVKPDDEVSIPLLPPGPGAPYPRSISTSPYAIASAPEPSTLDKD